MATFTPNFLLLLKFADSNNALLHVWEKASLLTDVNIELKNVIVEYADINISDINIFKCHDRIVINTSPSGIVTSPLTLGKLTMPSATRRALSACLESKVRLQCPPVRC